MADETRVRVWDWPTRAFHWLIVMLIAFAWWTYRADRMEWHRYAGYAVLALLVFRIFWGFFGSETARFAAFIKGPREIWRYVTGRAGTTPGHNPLGALSVVALLAVVAVQAASGLFVADDEGLDSGPLATRVSYDTAQAMQHWHALIFNVLLGLVALHVAAIAIYALRGDNLVWPMIGGTKKMPAGTSLPAHASTIALVVGFLLAGAAMAGLVWLERSV